MAGEVVVDALPYIDQGYDEPGVREAASAMVEEECRRFRPTKNYLEHLPPLNVTAFETPMMHTEFERLQNRLPMDTMSMKRYELPPPPSGKLNEEKAWFECVENSQAQLEHQAVRILNLQLMLEYCCPAWQRYLQTLSDCEKIASKKIAELRQALQEVNWQRKSLQTKGGEQLRNLEAKWVALVSHNYEIEQACCMAEEYIVNMRSQLKNYHKQQEEYQQQQEEYQQKQAEYQQKQEEYQQKENQQKQEEYQLKENQQKQEEYKQRQEEYKQQQEEYQQHQEEPHKKIDSDENDTEEVEDNKTEDRENGNDQENNSETTPEDNSPPHENDEENYEETTD